MGLSLHIYIGSSISEVHFFPTRLLHFEFLEEKVRFFPTRLLHLMNFENSPFFSYPSTAFLKKKTWVIFHFSLPVYCILFFDR